MNRLAARGRPIALLSLLMAAALMLVAALQPWWMLTPQGQETISLRGADVAAAIVPIAVAMAVLSITLLVASGMFRRILGIAAAALGVLAIVHLGTLGEPTAVFENTIASLSGITTSRFAAEPTSANFLAWAAALVSVLGGIWTVATGHRWEQRAQKPSRFERAESGLDWDALDEGIDPTESAANPNPRNR